MGQPRNQADSQSHGHKRVMPKGGEGEADLGCAKGVDGGTNGPTGLEHRGNFLWAGQLDLQAS